VTFPHILSDSPGKIAGFGPGRTQERILRFEDWGGNRSHSPIGKWRVSFRRRKTLATGASMLVSHHRIAHPQGAGAAGADRESAPPQAGRHSHDHRSLPQQRRRIETERTLHRVAQRPRRVRFSFEDRAGNRPAKPSGLGMVSTSQLTAASATEARYRSDAARCAAGPDADRRLDGPVGRVVWNTRKIHFSRSCKTAAARIAVKGGRSPARRAAGLPLDGHRSGGYARERACDAGSSTDPLLSTGLRRSNPGYSRRNRAHAHSLLSC
jgi:hypothetical protein